MQIFLIIVFIVSLFFSIGILNTKFLWPYSLREIIITTWILFLLWVYLITEILSCFNAINFEALYLVYIIFILLLLAFIILEKTNFLTFLKQLKPNAAIKNHYLSFIGIMFILSITGFTASYSAPNNWDSMTYHLGRMMHWIQNENIANFPTHISRQLFNPPLVEYTMMHFYLLGQGDRWLNCVQFFSFVECIITVSLIVRALGYNFKIQVFSSLIMATLPMAILQASNTKNELTIAFLSLTVIYCILKYKNSGRILYLWFTGFTTGLAFLTKSTAFIYLLPVFAIYWFPYPFQTIKTKVKDGLIISCIALILVAPIYLRNYNSYGHPLGATAEERSWYSNNEFTWKTLVSNVSRNVYIHLSNVLLFDDEALFNKQGIFFRNQLYKLHASLQINILDPKTTWRIDSEFTEPLQTLIYKENFQTKLGNCLDFTLARDEDCAGNYLHLILIITGICFVPFCINRMVKHSEILKHGLILILSSLFFCIYLKWQPWHSRLHVVYFILACPLLAILLSKFNSVLRFFILTLLFLGSITYLFENNTRPLLFKGSKIYELTRDEVMFVKKGSQVMEDYKNATDFAIKTNPKEVGIIIGEDGWDYPFWLMIKRKKPGIQIHHVQVSEKATPAAVVAKYPDVKPEIIISSESNHADTLTIADEIYINKKKLKTLDVYMKQ